MLFNVYYMNFPKVYEIKMMLSNIIKTDQTIEKGENEQVDIDLQGRMGIKFLKLFNSEIGAEVKSASTDSQKVLETFKITTTKSLILNEVIEKSRVISQFNNALIEGTLIRLDGVVLSLENETELRTVKMFSNGSFKGMRLPEAGGLDINNLFNSMFKDYAYKIKGKLNSNDEDEILIKIPMTFENEFENSYNVDDLFIGNVSIIGIYKGKTKVDNLTNSFEFFQDLEQIAVGQNEGDVHYSQFPNDQKPTLKSAGDNKDYYYIDLLAIVQVVNAQII